MRRLNSLLTESKPRPIAISGIMKLSAAMKENGTRLEAEVKMRRNRNGSDCRDVAQLCRVTAPPVSAPKAITNSISTIMRALLR